MRILLARQKCMELHFSDAKPRAWPGNDTQFSILCTGSQELLLSLKDCPRAERVPLRDAILVAGGVQHIIDLPAAPVVTTDMHLQQLAALPGVNLCKRFGELIVKQNFVVPEHRK